MSLSRFAVTSSFSAWSPADRDHPERQVSMAPGPKHLFTDEAEPSGVFVKFLKNGSWYEADRNEFARSTVPLREHPKGRAISARHGG
jgi:hypothetical protein